MDLNALLMLMTDPDDDTFVLGGRGIQVEICVVCNTLRVSKFFDF
jgi:hypothetical protein